MTDLLDVDIGSPQVLTLPSLAAGPGKGPHMRFDHRVRIELNSFQALTLQVALSVGTEWQRSGMMVAQQSGAGA